jgi:glyoxylase-like metal-dependent hydrolase (beta-lactamase superfamily II)
MSLQFVLRATGLWVARCRGYAMNTGVVQVGAHAVLIDPALAPDEVGDIARFCAERDLQVESVVITHHHWDHVLGAGRFPEARVVTHQSYLAEAVLELAHTRAAAARYLESEGFPAGPLFEPGVPDVTVEESLDLPVGASRLHLFHTPGHARDHLSVEGPAGAWLWAGDLLSDREIPFVSDRLSACEETLASLAAMNIALLVPGHGTVTADPVDIAARLRDDRAYLAELHRRVVMVVAAGGTVQDAAAACADMAFRCPGANADAHAMNVEQAFVELGGAPFSPSLGWAREL